MAEVRLHIPDSMVQSLQEMIGIEVKPTEIAKDAIAILAWAVGERNKGRYVLSSEGDGNNMHRLVMPCLEAAFKKKE